MNFVKKAIFVQVNFNNDRNSWIATCKDIPRITAEENTLDNLYNSIINNAREILRHEPFLIQDTPIEECLLSMCISEPFKKTQ